VTEFIIRILHIDALIQPFRMDFLRASRHPFHRAERSPREEIAAQSGEPEC
jgi:hypothetical protein